MMVLLCKLAELQELHPLAIELLVCFIEESVVNLGHCAKGQEEAMLGYTDSDNDS